MKNLEVRNKAKESGVFLWQIAQAMGISEPTMTRKMRTELSEVEKEKMLKVIHKLSEETPCNS